MCFLTPLIRYIGHSDDIWVTAPVPFMAHAEALWKEKFPSIPVTFEQGHLVYELVSSNTFLFFIS
jgi:hypothetical protein